MSRCEDVYESIARTESVVQGALRGWRWRTRVRARSLELMAFAYRLSLVAAPQGFELGAVHNSKQLAVASGIQSR
jgi:hypothetical protein